MTRTSDTLRQPITALSPSRTLCNTANYQESRQNHRHDEAVVRCSHRPVSPVQTQDLENIMQEHENGCRFQGSDACALAAFLYRILLQALAAHSKDKHDEKRDRRMRRACLLLCRNNAVVYM